MIRGRNTKLINLNVLLNTKNLFTKYGRNLLRLTRETGIAQLVSAQPSELEATGSILCDSNVCFDFLLIRVALALNTRKTEH